MARKRNSFGRLKKRPGFRRNGKGFGSADAFWRNVPTNKRRLKRASGYR